MAELDERPLGHAVFSPVGIDGGDFFGSAVGLGPVAVHPDHQRLGVGSLLIETGLARLKSAGHDVVVVLGHPGYYPRFGFRPAHELGLGCTFPVPPDVFMAQELQRGALKDVKGTVHYHPAFQGR